MGAKPFMYLIAGPNGVGKSTLYEARIKPHTPAPFINADLIQRDELKDASMQASYGAAEIAEQRRQQHLASRSSFVTESTFSHPSKLQLVGQAKAAGFRVVLYHVSVRSPNLSVDRVSMRFRKGGHNVPEDKIRERFERNKPIIRQAVLLADRAFVYDNSELGRAPLQVIEFKQGRVVDVGRSVPAWVRDIYADELAPFSPAVLNPAAASFADAKQIVGRIGGQGATLQIASAKDTRGYLGPMVGESALHYVQHIGDSQFVAHFKSGLPHDVGLHRLYLIKYDKTSVAVQEKDPASVLAVAQSRSMSPERIEALKKLFTLVQPVRVSPPPVAYKGPKL